MSCSGSCFRSYAIAASVAETARTSSEWRGASRGRSVTWIRLSCSSSAQIQKVRNAAPQLQRAELTQILAQQLGVLGECLLRVGQLGVPLLLPLDADPAAPPVAVEGGHH